MNCKDCKHWNRIRNFLHERTFANPAVPKMKQWLTVAITDDPQYTLLEEGTPSGFGTCACPSIGPDNGPVYGHYEPYGSTSYNDEMHVEGSDDSGRYILETGENFGCVHFEQQP